MSDVQAVETILGALVATLSAVWIVAVAILVLVIVANWKVFTKAGEKGWKSIVPILNTITLFKIAGVSPLLILGYLLSFIPVLGAVICLGITIYVYYKLAKAFGKDAGFVVGLVLLNSIFMMILGFGKAEYQLEAKN